ncbi:hypothetical protein MMC30_004409 [Trapelia coarctata]|nr:hypothetical protein [Trapelia coarctata]
MDAPEYFEPPSSYMTPPPSPGKRRRQLRESEETDGNMSLEQYIYWADDYRKSTVEKPLPLPLRYERPEAQYSLDGPRFQSFVPRIFKILEENGIREDQAVARMLLVSRPGYPGGATPVLTLVIDINQGVLITRSLGVAKDQISRLMVTNGILDVEVELYDPQRAYMPMLSPLGPEEPVLVAYRNVRQELIDYIHERLDHDWRAMSIFGFGTKDSTVKPAVVILVKPKTVHDWKTVSHKLSYILRGFPGISIEFLPGHVGDIHGRSFASIPNRMQPTPMIGSSIDEVGQPGGGTLGGFVTLEGNGIKQHGFLTNHHVVRPYAPPPHVIHAINQSGYGTERLVTNIQYPAKDELTAALDGINVEIKTVKTQMDLVLLRGRHFTNTFNPRLGLRRFAALPE